MHKNSVLLGALQKELNPQFRDLALLVAPCATDPFERRGPERSRL